MAGGAFPPAGCHFWRIERHACMEGCSFGIYVPPVVPLGFGILLSDHKGLHWLMNIRAIFRPYWGIAVRS